MRCLLVIRSVLDNAVKGRELFQDEKREKD